MSIWEHKAAHEIARAVEMHMRVSSAKSQYGHQLILGAYKEAKQASTTTQTDQQNLKDIRACLCIACRGDALYKCDVSEGWSHNCAFLRQCE
jgi:hypothetical protein